MSYDPDSLLLTDLYQLSMLQSYRDEGLEERAVFEFFVRALPAGRNFLVCAGLEQLVRWLEQARFVPEELDWLARSGRWSSDFIDYLAHWRFTGDVDAMPEGTPCFADEPLVRVSAPLPEAQLVESRLSNILQFQTLVASKAVRCVLAAQGRGLVDFGLRRAHGGEAGLLAARAAYLAGFDATATVLAGRQFDIPLAGTMAHSYIQAHDSETEALRRFVQSHPHGTTLLIDTYDTEVGARRVVALLPELRARGMSVAAVRLDSGDLLVLSRTVRTIFDEAGYADVKILCSGGVDEHRIAELVAAEAPIDGFGVGTALTVAEDAPSLDCAYKLQEYAGVARRKRSSGKATWPGPRQVFRRVAADGRFAGDVVTPLGEQVEGARPLLRPVMRQGRAVGERPSLDSVRDHCAHQLGLLPDALRRLEPPRRPYPVEISESLQALAREVDRRLERP